MPACALITSCALIVLTNLTGLRAYYTLRAYSELESRVFFKGMLRLVFEDMDIKSLDSGVESSDSGGRNIDYLST